MPVNQGFFEIINHFKSIFNGIPETNIEKCYVETFYNLKEILKDCDLAAFYDNTEEFRRFAILRNDEVVRLSRTLPKWIEGKGII